METHFLYIEYSRANTVINTNWDILFKTFFFKVYHLSYLQKYQMELLIDYHHILMTHLFLDLVYFLNFRLWVQRGQQKVLLLLFYESEIRGLISALKLIHLKSLVKRTQLIFTDSKSIIEPLEDQYENPNLLAFSIQSLLTSYVIDITLQWIPVHSDLQGNDRKLAKMVLRRNSQINLQVTKP